MASCPNDCNHHGICNSNTGKCLCDSLYDGEDCTERWRSNHDWFILWNVFIAVALVLHTILLVICVRFLYTNFDKIKKSRPSRWPISIHIMILGFIAALLRIVVLAVDPYSEREILPFPVWAVLFNIPIVIAECIVLMLFLYWFEVAQKKRLDFPSNVKKLRPLLIGLCVFIACVLLPIAVVANSILNALLINLSNILLAVVLLCIFVLLSLAGVRLITKLDSLRIPTNLPSREQSDRNANQDIITAFIFRVRWYLALIGISMAAEVILLVTYVITDSRYKPWNFVCFHFAFRVFEFTYIMPTLFLLVQRKRPSQNNVTNLETTFSMKSIT